MDDKKDGGGDMASDERAQEAGSSASLVWGVARSVTSALETGRGTMAATVDEVSGQLGRLLGKFRDAGEDLVSYVTPTTWLEDLYASLGIASSGTICEIDERMDSVELHFEEVRRQRARDELLVLQQRIVELETLLADLSKGEAHQAMEQVLGRLAELESRIDALPAGVR